MARGLLNPPAMIPLTPLRANPAPLLCRDPYRLLFPLGIALAWAGVFHWILFASGASEEYRSVFHSMAQIQGFMACFAAGFLLTFIPRRTGTAAPSRVEVAIAAAAPIATTALAWMEKWALAQVCWLVLLGMLVVFAVRRVKARKGPIPGRFVWVVVAVLCGAGGAVLAGFGAATDRMVLHDVGRAIVLQGFLSALVFGIGGVVLPPFTHGRPAPEHERVRAHVLPALLFLASFFVDVESMRAGFLIRAAIAAALLLPRLWRPPTQPGFHRLLLWISAWALPIGNLAVAAFPEYRRIGLHVVFIGCFALMALAISFHVALAHGGQVRRLSESPVPLRAMGALLAIALLLRLLVDLAPGEVRLWIGGAAGAFLTATVCWALLVAPALRPPRASA
jgi:uncharacterized protein involved in response to NO